MEIIGFTKEISGGVYTFTNDEGQIIVFELGDKGYFLAEPEENFNISFEVFYDILEVLKTLNG